VISKFIKVNSQRQIISKSRMFLRAYSGLSARFLQKNSNQAHMTSWFKGLTFKG